MSIITSENFSESFDKVLAYNSGALDSCGDGKDLEQPLAGFLRNLNPAYRRGMLAGFANGMTSLDRTERGYGLADLRKVIEWLDEHVPGWEE